MRKIDRSRVVMPARLDMSNPNSAASKELQRLKAKVPASFKASDFNAYKDENKKVLSALLEISNNKCAYCESRIAGSSQVDIEHYRPKGKVEESQDHPGYWWLAMKWENLLPSCMHCNQSRSFVQTTHGMTEEEYREALEKNQRESRGKVARFPTIDGFWETNVDANPDTSEQPYLINPAVTDPKGMFDWDISQDMIVTMKGIDPAGRGRKTIEILGFSRSFYAEDLGYHMQALKRMRDRIRNNMEAMRISVNLDTNLTLTGKIYGAMESLKELTLEDTSYSAVSEKFYNMMEAEVGSFMDSLPDIDPA
ncbi:hypothetical protein N9W89_07790 [Hellea sp.]|nr:hypothetical protein [Hellea sp.]